MALKLWWNTALMLLTRVSDRLANVLLFTLIARRLGAESAGAFNLALTYTAISLTLSLWGLDELLVRDVAKDRRRVGSFLLHFGVVRFVLALSVYGALLLLLYFVLPYPLRTRQLIGLMGLTLMADGMNLLGQSVFTAFGDLRLPALIALIIGASKAIGGISALLVTSDILSVGVVFVLSSWIGVVIYVWGLTRLLSRQNSKVHWDKKFLRRELAQTPAFAMIGLLYVVSFQFDVILLSLLRNEEAVGWYGVAQTVFTIFLLVPQAYRAALYPMMSRLYETEGNNGARLGALYTTSLHHMLSLGLPLALGLTLLAPQIVSLFFEHPSMQAIQALRWIAWALFIQYLNVPNVRLMLASERQGQSARFLTISVAVSLLANLFLIPYLGVPGAGLVRFLSSFTFLALNYFVVQRHICRYTPRWEVLSAIIASALMGGVLGLVQNQVLWIKIPIGIGAYGIPWLILNIMSDRLLFSIVTEEKEAYETGSNG